MTLKSETAESVDSESSVAKPEEKTAEPKTRYIVTLYHLANIRPWNTIGQAVVDHIHRRLKELTGADQASRENSEIDLWLDSSGGNLDAAFKLVLVLQHYSSLLRVVIPDYAKSAATLIAIAADELYMGPAAELGPLDAQIQHPEREDLWVSALDYAQALDHLANTALGVVLTGGSATIKATGFTRQQVFSPLLEFAASFFSPAVAKLDPSLIHNAARTLKVAAEYCQRLLEPKCENTSDLQVREKYDELPNRLISGYSSHGFVISRKEATDLGLAPKNSDEYADSKYAFKLWETVRQGNTFHIDTERRDEIVEMIGPPTEEKDSEA